MSLTGHRVICWDENGEICNPVLILGRDRRICLYKEAVYCEIKQGDEWRVVTQIKDGYAMFGNAYVIVRGEFKKLLFFFGTDEHFRFGLAKHEDMEEITDEDIRDLTLFLMSLVLNRYTPGYTFWNFITGYVPPLLKTAIEKIKEVKKLDQGDAMFSECLKFRQPVYEWFECPITVMDKILGKAEGEFDDYIERLKKIAEKIEKCENLTDDEREFLLGALESYIFWLIDRKL